VQEPAPNNPFAASLVSAPPAPMGGQNLRTIAMVDKLYTFMAPDPEGCLGGAQLSAVMAKSQPPLNNQMMGGIWALADTTKRGKLDKDQLVTLFGMMSIAQAGVIPSAEAVNASTPCPVIIGLEL